MQKFSPSNNAIKLITTFENCELTSREVSTNLYAVGYKHVGRFIDKKITKTEAANLLKDDIVSYGIKVYNIIKKHKLTINQDQYDALVDIFFDLESQFDIFKVVSQETIEEAAKVILTLGGDEKRRKADYDLFITGKIAGKTKKDSKDEEEAVEEKEVVEKKPAAKKETIEKKSVVKKIKEAVEKAEKKPAAKKITKKKVEEK